MKQNGISRGIDAFRAIDSSQQGKGGHEVHCRECGTTASGQSQFCGRCGAATASGPPVTTDPLNTVLSLEATPEVTEKLEAVGTTTSFRDSTSLGPVSLPATRTCTTCSESLPEGAQFCAVCGQHVAPSTPKLDSCRSCGEGLPEGARFCAACGTPHITTPESCGSCGEELGEGANFCIACGASASTAGSGAAALSGPLPPKHETAQQTDLLCHTFHPNLLLFWLTQTLGVSPKQIHGEAYSTFWVIPTGKRKVMFPLRQVAGVEVGTRLRIGRALLGALLLIAGVLVFNLSALIGVLLVAVGLSSLLTCVVTGLDVTNSGGLTQTVYVSILEKAKMSELADAARRYVVDL